MSTLKTCLEMLGQKERRLGLTWLFCFWSLSPENLVSLDLLQSIHSVLTESLTEFQFMLYTFQDASDTLFQLSEMGLLLVMSKTVTAVDGFMLAEGLHSQITALFTVAGESLNPPVWDSGFQSLLLKEIWIDMTLEAFSLFLERNPDHITEPTSKHLDHLLRHAQRHDVSSLLRLPSSASVGLVQFVAESYAKLEMFDQSMQIYEIRIKELEAGGDNNDSVLHSRFTLYRLLGRLYMKRRGIDDAINYLLEGVRLPRRRWQEKQKAVADVYLELAELLLKRSVYDVSLSRTKEDLGSDASASVDDHEQPRRDIPRSWSGKGCRHVV